MKTELELRQMFKNLSDCYADTRIFEQDKTFSEGAVIQAITEDRFIELLKELKLLPIQKEFYTVDNVGKAKYTVNFYDGIQTHKDGSKFFGIRIFSNIIKRDKFIKELINEGYIQSR